ncbi:MAG: MerR family transcriptional regulator [Oscillospiraceae bacterium]|nr:MerR family transcriptional regulator [Oscillospiraceae bacterium]
MSKNFSVGEAQEMTGISRQNIRFYEKQGLIKPQRNPSNDYREYTEEDLRTLKVIRMLRMLDMPIEDIRCVLEGSLPLCQAAREQQARLKGRQASLEAAIRFCETLEQEQVGVQALDVDNCLTRMNQPAPESGEKTGYFTRWAEDYKKVALSEHEKVFTFIPDDAVTNPREFTSALFAYANEHDLNLVITRESMNPKFTIDGMEYEAERVYGVAQHIPVAIIRCSVLHPEDFEPEVAEERKGPLKFLYRFWPTLLAFVCYLLWFWDQLGPMMSSWEGWLLVLVIGVIILTCASRGWYYHFNENGKTGKRNQK